VQAAVHEAGEYLGFVQRIHDQALEIDEHEVVVLVVFDTFLECER